MTTRKTKTRKTKKRVRLPNSVPALTELAVRNSIRCEEQPEKYRLNMGAWVYRQNGSRKIDVCMAGAVMAQTLGVRPKEGEQLSPTLLLDPRTRRRIFAVDEVRGGWILQAYRFLDQSPPHGWRAVKDAIQAGYGRPCRRAPWSVYLHAAQTLRRLERAETKMGRVKRWWLRIWDSMW